MHFPPRVAVKINTAGWPEYSRQRFRTPGSVTLHAGTLPALPWSALRATFTPALSENELNTSGAANGGACEPFLSPADPLDWVRSVLSPISASTRTATTPRNQP